MIGLYQYQVKTEPVLVPASTIPPSMDSWFRLFSEPKRVEKTGLNTSQQPFFFFYPGTITPPPETITEDKWHFPWSEPVRVKINPQEAVALIASGVSWDLTPVPPPPETVTEDKWHFPWSTPVRLPIGLKAYYQDFYISPIKFPETPYITGTMTAYDTPDTFRFGGTSFNQVASAKVGVIDLLPGMRIPVRGPALAGIIEITPIYANVGTVGSITATESGSVASSSYAARVSIRTS